MAESEPGAVDLVFSGPSADLERRLGLYLFVDMGVSPLVTHMRAFVFGDLGVGLSYRVADRVRGHPHPARR